MPMDQSPRQAPGTGENSSPDQAATVQVLSCISCAGPVASSAAKCFACGSPVTGKEFKYVARQQDGPDIQGMLKWWGIWSLGIFALGGFAFDIGPTLAIIAVSMVYIIRLLRAY